MTLQFRKDIAVTNFTLSDEINQLFDAVAVRNVNEAIAVLFHGFLLESGFIPKDVLLAEIYKMMPKDWNGKGFFKIKYSHYCCPSFTCCVTCVPLYNNVSVHGIICDTLCSESVSLKMKLGKYLKQKKDFLNACEIFTCIDELSKHFKDNFCLPLLNLLHETGGVKRLYGFPGLFDELKILILTLLPVESVVSMSAVNKNLHNLANLSFLWKYLYKRDFGKGITADVDTSSKIDWKKKYKNEYLKKNRKPEPLIPPPYYRLPQIFTEGTDIDSDFYINFDPPFPGSSSFFQPLHPRLPPPFFSPPSFGRFYQWES